MPVTTEIRLAGHILTNVQLEEILPPLIIWTGSILLQGTCGISTFQRDYKQLFDTRIYF